MSGDKYSSILFVMYIFLYCMFDDERGESILHIVDTSQYTEARR